MLQFLLSRIKKLSFSPSVTVFYDAVSLANMYPTFRDNRLDEYLRVCNIKILRFKKLRVQVYSDTSINNYPVTRRHI